MQIEHRLPILAEYKELRASAGWWKTDDKATDIALSKSLFSVVAIKNDNVIGLVRVVGDGGLYFYIQDLIVRPEFRGNEFGKKLVNEAMSYIKANAKSGAFVGLMAAKGLEKYYELFGFKARDENAPGMYQVIK